MSSFLVEQSTSGVCATPLSVPLVELPADTGLPIAQFRLEQGQVLTLPYLSVHFVGYRTLGSTARINLTLPVVYAGLTYQVLHDMPPARPILMAGLDAPGVTALMPRKSVEFTAPGIYRVLLVNNHASCKVAALVTGVAQLFNVTNG